MHRHTFLKNCCYYYSDKKLVLQAAQYSPLSNRPDYFLLYRASYLKCTIMRWWYVLHPMRFLESNQSSYGFYRIFIYPIIFERAMNLPTLKASQLICLMSKSIFCLRYNANCGFALLHSILLVWFGKMVAFDILITFCNCKKMNMRKIDKKSSFVYKTFFGLSMIY